MKDPSSKLQSALIFHQQGKLAQAEELYRDILRFQPANFEALFLLATASAQQKKFSESIVFFDKAIAINSRHPEAQNNRANVLLELKRFDEALAGFEKVLALKPDNAESYSNKGIVFQELKHYEKALNCYEKSLSINPRNADTFNNRGVVFHLLERYTDAVSSYQKAVALKPDYAAAYNNLGNSLRKLKHYEDALCNYENALTLRKDYAEAYLNRGYAFADLKRYDEALESFDLAINCRGDYAEAYISRGDVLLNLKRYNEALACFDHVIFLRQNNAIAYNKRGIALQWLKRYEEAVLSYEKALLLTPGDDSCSGQCFLARMKICDWMVYNQSIDKLIMKINEHNNGASLFGLLGILNSPVLQKKAAEAFILEHYSGIDVLPAIQNPLPNDKIRIGYFSADFRKHATSVLAAGMFESHDKSRFETIAFSFGPDTTDEMKKRVSAAFDRFLDVRTMPDNEIARLSRKLGIDIAIDLGGFTTHSRTGILALHAAPLQVSYLGYPGTMGAAFIDYIIADATLIPEESRKFYTEKVIYLPHTYQVNDSRRVISSTHVSRDVLGLPEKGFVFCCFNNNHKITPSVFDSWMRILKMVDGSVLWLLEDNATATGNLRIEAVQRGVEAERIVFAKRIHVEEHLARHRSADLFLDTLPYNAHTTASDALWAGLPVLTLVGESFASRVAASLLKAIQLPELITYTREEYEASAVELATSPEKLREIKEKLERNRLTTPLFDTKLFTRHIEVAYTMMYERFHAGLSPDHIFVSPHAS